MKRHHRFFYFHFHDTLFTAIRTDLRVIVAAVLAFKPKIRNVHGGSGNESHCIKADGSQRCRISQVPLFYRPSSVASSFSMPLSPLSMQPSTRLPSSLFYLSCVLLCPSLSSTRGLVLPLDSTPYFFLYPYFGLRTVGSRLFFSSLRPSVFIYPLPRFSTHPVFSLRSPFIPDSSPRLFLPSCLTFLGQMPRGYSFRRGITFIVSVPLFLATPFSQYSFVITR